LLVGLTSASAQAFFTVPTPGTHQVRFTSNGQGVQIAVDNQQAGTIPMTLWVLPGVHQFSFTAPGQPTKTIPYPVNADVDVPFMFTPKTFPVTVNTNVPGAALAIDGQAFAGNTTSVAPGNHTLTVSAPGYRPMNLPFQQPSNANTLNVTLVANTFSLTVNTNVPGATLAIDGQAFAGNTTSVAPGNHTLTVSAPGYQPMTLPFVQPSNANTLNVTLVANTFPLTVNTNVPGAVLAIDGLTFAGNAVTVIAGNHTLTVTAPGYQPMTLPFVQPSSANTLNVTLVALRATLTINTEKLFRAGTPFSLFLDNVETRGPILSVSPGAHTLRIVAGSLSIETSLSLNAGQTLTLVPSVLWEMR
jgi:hypothetical protein